MLKRAFLLVFAVFLIQETNLGSLFLGADCVETCPDDTSPRHCPPTCSTCSCGTHVNPVPPATMRLPRPTPRECCPLCEAAAAPADGHSGEIGHVPKQHLS